MKKILLVLSVLAVVACQEEQPKKDYVTFSGTITNPNTDSLLVEKRGFKKVIAVNKDGSFSDTLKVDDGMYFFYDGVESSALFLKNGYDLNLTMDTKEFDESIKYTGEGAENNNFLAEKALKEEKIFGQDFDKLDAAGLNKAMIDASNELSAFIDGRKGLDSLLVVKSKESLQGTIDSMKGYYGSMIALREAFPKGSPSPTFEDYENFKGGTTSLSDLEGKYVYIDVWATWCAPCKAEIPFLKKLEAEMHDKNITFVSMSIDDDRTHKGSWEQAKEDWKAMVADKELSGVQIMAPKGWQSTFIRDYRIQGIPRFILIDPNGKVVDPSAPRPSDPALKTMLADLL
ncbi:TlpA family protein disulfide reductase [Rasiella rasia]|uniref:TlpA family protein disulfide reductase n=1 Tax=Rasiella rasia TaxID=2744027 RepID=A0A6G6GIX1_9FLAO|nr:TlpA disulfide reductase family protein [Rasiella rasia]QIE58499.1 TlpA family protein disulfide reductase [Rasiella rasia]